MIITRTPFRVSFIGGGTDFRDFYIKNGFGAVISAAIQKYVYIIIHPYFHDKIRIKYSKTEDVCDIESIEHPIVRECLRKVNINKGVEIASFADVSSGTGLGSSSAFTVGLLNALYAFKGQMVSKKQLAKEACEIEIDVLEEPIGKQDQYASAFGNFNYISFNNDETVDVSPFLLKESLRDNLETNLSLYYIGGERHSRDILNEQKKNLIKGKTDEQFDYLRQILDLVEEFKQSIIYERFDYIGSILHRGWQLKKKLASNITNETVDQLYDRTLKYGSEGGKLLGAGGAGFLLISHKNHKELSKEMNCGFMPLKIDREGTKIIFYE